MRRRAEHEIPERWLLDRLDGRLTPARAARVEEHLAASCAHCTSLLREIEALRARIADGPLPAAPRDAVRRAVKLFAAQRRSEWFERAAEGVRRVVAQLVFDQALAPAAALRAGEAAERRIVWTVGDDELFVAVSSDRTGWTVDGQFLAAKGDAAGARLRLVRGGRPLPWQTLESEGRFRMSGLEPGLYRIEGERARSLFYVPAFSLE